MAKDKSKSSKPLFEDPFAELDDPDKASDALVEPKSRSKKQPTAKTSAKPKTKKGTADTSKPKTTSRKRAVRKTAAESKAAKKTAPRKPTAKKTRTKPKGDKKGTSSAKQTKSPRKRVAKKTATKHTVEKKTTASTKQKTSPRKRTVKQTVLKPKPATEAKTELKPEIPSPKVKDESKNELEIVDQATLGEEITVEVKQEDSQTSESARTLLESLITSLEEGDKDDDRRALAALPFIRQIEQIAGEQHIVFLLAETEYATHIESVLEIGEPLNTTPVPNVPEWVMGIANLRGDIISVVDLRTFMGLPPRGQGEASRMLVLQSRDREFSTCFVVDDVRGIRYLDMERISDHVLPDTDIMAQFVDGFYDHEGQSLVVLDVERMLLSKRMQAL